jgi:hypothetical protein
MSFWQNQKFKEKSKFYWKDPIANIYFTIFSLFKNIVVNSQIWLY